jgi:chemotaxis protein histidine kinase CheA
MPFDVYPQITALFEQQAATLAACDDRQAAYASLSDALHALIDRCSEQDLSGLADTFALYSELLEQSWSELTPSAEQQTLMCRFADNFANLSAASFTDTLCELLASEQWPEPVPDDDIRFLRELLENDLSHINTAAPEGNTAVDTHPLIAELQQQLQATPPEALADHCEQWVDLCSEAELAGLADMFALAAELYSQSSDEIAQALTAAVTSLLTAIDEHSIGALLDTLTDNRWPEPIAADDAAFLRDLLLDDAVRLNPAASACNAAPDAGAGAQDTAESRHPLAMSIRRQLADARTDELAELSHRWVDQCSEAELPGLADAFALATELYAQPHGPATEALTQALKNLLAIPGTTTLEALLRALTRDDWEEPVPEDDAEFLHEMLEADCAQLHTAADSCAPIDIPAFCEVNLSLLDEAGPNIDPTVLQMLTGTLQGLRDRWQATDTAEQAALAPAIGESLQPILRALDTLHLRGVHSLISGLCTNLALFSTLSPPVTTLNQVGHCLRALQENLANPENPDVHRELVDLFSSPLLPCHMRPEQAGFISGLLALATVQTAADIKQEIANPEHVALQMHDDIDPGLQDMLFVELPSLVEEFLEHIQAVITSSSLEQIGDARRTAHTIKGLANMAGIQGLANLTHGLEDILDRLVDAQTLPGKQLSDDLLEAADSLAAMGEAVTDNAPAPDNAVEILQRIYDWSYLLKTQGVEAAAGEAPAAPTGSSAPSDESAAQTAPASDSEESDAAEERQEENYLRVPQSLLDNLFRITGESTTLTSQLDEVLTQLRTQTRANRERQRNMQRVIFELEQQLNEYYTLHPELSPDSEGFDPLEMDNYNEMHTSISRLHEAAADVREVEQEMDSQIRLLSDLHVAQSGLQKESMANILNTRLVPVKSISSRVQRIMRQACRAAGKQAELEIVGEATQVDSQILSALTDPLMHIIRNAVDHGLESPHDRFEAGKPETGTLKLSFRQANNEIRVVCEDDGAGIDTARIREAALRKGLIKEDDSLSEAELQRLILMPGFSTRTEVSQLSGRGIGMDVVYQQVMRLQGTLNITSELGKGTRFELTMPSSSLMIRALLVRAGRQLVALSSHGVEQSLISIDGRLEDTPEGQQFIVGDERYPARTLEGLVGERAGEYCGSKIHPVLIVNLGQGERVAVMVREILAHRELVFKEMGSYIPDIPGIPGVTILANGEAAPIIDLPARIRHAASRTFELSDKLEIESSLDLPKLMVVDDSVSARKSLATFLKDTGYEVATAIDGLDALNQIRKNPPDLILTDLEMPRMTGIELSAAVRSHQNTLAIPIIMITSRSTDKHREEADAAGVSAYLTKPWTESGLLSSVESLLT